MAKSKKTVAKRHEKAAKKMPGIRKTRVKRLGRRAGVARMSGSVLVDMTDQMIDHLRVILKEAAFHMEYRRQTAKRIKASDVEEALKRHGEKVFGYGQ